MDITISRRVFEVEQLSRGECEECVAITLRPIAGNETLHDFVDQTLEIEVFEQNAAKSCVGQIVELTLTALDEDFA